MAQQKASIETGVDKLVSLVSAKKRISMKDASKELGVSQSSVEEWAAFLEEEGIITIEYKFTTPYLIPKAFSDKEIADKVKRFSADKENMKRKAESGLAYLEKEKDALSEIKNDFLELKKSFGSEFEKAKGEIEKLEKYSKMKKELEESLIKQKADFEKNIKVMGSQLADEEGRYAEMTRGLQKYLDEEKDAEKKFEDVERRLKEEEGKLKKAEGDMSDFAKRSDEIRKEIEKKKGSLSEYKKESEEYIRKYSGKIDELISLIKEHEKSVSEIAKKGEQASERFKDVISKKEKAEKIIDSLDKEEKELEKMMQDFLVRIKVFETASKKQNIKEGVDELEKKFGELEKKKGAFKKDLEDLYGLFKKK